MEEKKRYKMMGKLIYYILKVLLKTCKIERVDKNGIVEKFPENHICVFWHNKLAGGAGVTKDLEKKAALASPSKDGELISVPLENFGYKVVRGSSGSESVRGLLGMLKLLKQGYTLGTPVDGPKGPVYKVKLGMLYLSQKSGKPILPMGFGYEKAWCLKKTWDKLVFPKPFSKIVCCFGDAFVVGKEENLDEVATKVEVILNGLDKKAKSLSLKK